jgi:hypothetical protein
MPVRMEDIALGRCYVTSTYRVRKVLFISGENVRYVSRGSKNFIGWERSGYRATSTRARFAQECGSKGDVRLGYGLSGTHAV